MNEYGTFKHFKISRQGRVAIFTLNNPEKKNILDEDAWVEMRQCQDILESMDDIGAIVMNAAGKHFSAGINIRYLQTANSFEVMRKLPAFQSIYSRWESMAVPVIASVHGACIGNAAELTLACDLRIAAKSAVISMPEVKVGGLSPDFGGTVRLTKLVGMGQAKRLILTGEQITADEAKRIGLVEYVVEDDQLEEATMKLAKGIASQPPLGVLMAKKGINMASESSSMAGMLFEQAQAIYCCGTEDQKESLTSILEKREPIFSGK